MNELYIKDMYIYFQTNATTYEEAYNEFKSACDRAGIEIGGILMRGALRNENGEDID